MEDQGSRAGLASGLLGAGHFAVAATASSTVGALSDGTSRPMAGIMAACAIASLLASRAAATCFVR